MVKKLFKKQMVKEMKINDYDDEDNIHQYFICLKSKITQQPISKVSDIKNPHVLYHIYSNIYGPIQKTTQEDHYYFITFIDGYLQYIKFELLKTKMKLRRN